ncbi:helix-turn-helix transcriptional regulator [uncultured Agrococcus sp.]|uniref:helix-turn-helix transcriptional regulator n=1 Tax=uncultured Agrococcus sp. TaxID=382258 RepID=UPI0025CC77C1|nr:helix-turn-helix transcriptional regulator [uncultured Agrococcus sp.]
MTNLPLLGQRIKHYRTRAGKTLDEVSVPVGLAASQLSLIENGKREPRLSQLDAIATALEVETGDLLRQEPPTRRAALELDLIRLQQGSVYHRLGLPQLKPGRSMDDRVLESLVGLHNELERRSKEAIATPEQARRDATALRGEMEARNNVLPEIDTLAQEQLDAVGHERGSLTHRSVAQIANRLGFELVFVNDLPHSTRSVTDLENGKIFLPTASIPGGHGLRSLALQALAHRLLGHTQPATYSEFLRQRLEINYFAAATLMPKDNAVEYLRKAKKERNLAVEDFRDAFGVTHETAAMRLTNLATTELDLTLHFLRVDEDGSIVRAYVNDGLELPADPSGTVEGQYVCRHFASRLAFEMTTKAAEFHQYTDTPTGTYWCSTQTGTGTDGDFSITIGVPFDSAKYFRGSDTSYRETSTCPDARCCSKPASELAYRWDGAAWASAKMHQHVLSPLPSGTFPGVDDVELYDFLDRHTREDDLPRA